VEADCSGIKTDQTTSTPPVCPTPPSARATIAFAALKNCGYDIPPTHITTNLAPADIRKEGSGFDLPMALG
jgi:magnesium chelatase family protein